MQMKTSLLLIILFVSLSLSGQVTYTSTYFSNIGNPNGLNQEDDYSDAGWTPIGQPSSFSNSWTPAINIPIPFSFYGSPVDSFSASLNGIITFDTGAALGSPPNQNTNLPNSILPDKSICSFWDAFTSSPPTGSNDNVLIKTFGTTPNRQFWIRWYSMEMGNPKVTYSYPAIVLEETTNNIYMVDQYSSNSPALTTTVGVQLNQTTGVQHGNNLIPLDGNSSPYPDNDYYQFVPVSLFSNDVGITKLLSPTNPITPGNQNVLVQLKNLGINNLNTVDISWEVNSVAQAPFSWSGALTTNDSAGVTIGSYNFSVLNELKVWTEMPNGTADHNLVNDTSITYLCSSLSGAYTIGGSGADFQNISYAVKALEECGISGPVTFNITPGTYIENIVVPEISGASTVNTITFDGGSAATTSISWKPNTGENVAILLDGVDFLTIKNVTIEHAAEVNARGILAWKQADYCTISDCVFQMKDSLINNVVPLVASNDMTDEDANGDNANHLTVQNCTFFGGNIGIRLIGDDITANSFSDGVRILNNVFRRQKSYGIKVENMDGIEIIGNNVNNLTGNLGVYGIQSKYSMNYKLNENIVVSPGSGVLLWFANTSATPTQVAEIYNNMLTSSGTGAALSIQNSGSANIFHNSIYGSDLGISFHALLNNLDVRNNIFYSDDLTFLYNPTGSSTGLSKLDHNLYFTNGPDLVRYDVVYYANLTSLQAAYPLFNQNSVSVDPNFLSTSPTNPDLHLNGLGANDLGDPTVGITIDIDGDVRPLSPTGLPDIGADEYEPFFHDVAAIAFVSPEDFICGTTAIPIEVEIENDGLSTITTLDLHITATGAINTTFSYTYNDSIPFGVSKSIQVGTINVPNGGIVELSLVADLLNDGNAVNDTIVQTFTFLSTLPPTASNGIVCEGDQAILLPDFEPGISYGWFDSLGGNLLGIDTFVTPPLYANTTYQLKQIIYENAGLTTSYQGGNYCLGGNMFNITNLKPYDYEIDAFDLNFRSASNSTATFYYIPNGTYIGNETDSSSWTFLTTEMPSTTNPGGPTKVPLTNTLTIPAGETYAIYIEYYANYTFGPSVVSNGALLIDMGAGLCSKFGGVSSSGRSFNGAVYYNATDLSGNYVCNNTVTPVQVTVNDALVATGSSTDETTVGANDGTITISSIVGGTPPYSIAWSNGQTALAISNLAPGMYMGVITDSTGCTTTVDYTIYPGSSSNFEISALQSIELYPNPTTNQATLSFTLSESKDVRVKVLNTLGQVLFERQFPDVISETEQLQLGHHGSGVYFIQVSIDKQTITKRLLLVE